MKTLAALVMAAVAGPIAIAQQQTFTVSPDASQANITLNTTHEVVHGTFHLQAGQIGFDRAGKMSGTVTAQAGSGKTGNDSRDKRMNKEILKTDQFTAITFAPKSYSGTIAAPGDSTLQVSGQFTLLGIARDVTIPMQVHIEGSKATAKAHLVLHYIDWGVKNPSFLFWKAEDDVAVDLELAGTVGN